MDEDYQLVDRSAARARFAALRRRRVERSFVAQECGRGLADRTEALKIPPGLVLDVGCGEHPGADAKAALQRDVVGIDWCEINLPAGAVAADAESLPFADDSFGVVWCSLCMPWVGRPELALAEMYRVLAPGGLLLVSTLGPDSLREIREAFAGSPARTMGFFDMHDFGDLLTRVGFAEPIVDRDNFTLEYSSAEKLLSDLAQWGALAAPGMNKAMARKKHMDAAAARLVQPDGRARLTIEAVYAHAWAIPARPPKFSDEWQKISFHSAGNG